MATTFADSALANFNKRPFGPTFGYSECAQKDSKRPRIQPQVMPIHTITTSPMYSGSLEKQERRRVNPEALSARLGPEVVAALDALVSPGQIEMPSYAQRKTVQQRYNLDRRHIYDYYHSKGLRVIKEDKAHRPFVPMISPAERQVSIEELAQRHGLRPGGILHPPNQIPTPPIPAQLMSHPGSPIEPAKCQSLQRIAQEFIPSASLPSSAHVSVTSSPSPVDHPLSNSHQTEMDTIFISHLLEAQKKEQPSRGPLLHFVAYYENAARNDESVCMPPSIQLGDLEWLASPGDSTGLPMIPLDVQDLSRQEREEAYSFFSYAVGPASGLQESVGSYKSFMKKQQRYYFSALSETNSDRSSDSESIAVSPCHQPAPVSSCALFGEKDKQGNSTEDFKKWLMPSRSQITYPQAQANKNSDSEASLGNTDECTSEFLYDSCSVSSSPNAASENASEESVSSCLRSYPSNSIYESESTLSTPKSPQQVYQVFDEHGVRSASPCTENKTSPRRSLPFYNTLPLAIQNAPLTALADRPPNPGLVTHTENISSQPILFDQPMLVSSQAAGLDQGTWQSHPAYTGQQIGEWFDPQLAYQALDPDLGQQHPQDLSGFLNSLLSVQSQLDAGMIEPIAAPGLPSSPLFPMLDEYPQVEADSFSSQPTMHAPIPTRSFGWFGHEHTRNMTGNFNIIMASEAH